MMRVLSSVQPEDFDVVVLSGGDGTVSSLLYGLRGYQTPILVFLARHLLTPFEMASFLGFVFSFPITEKGS